jgi:O-antigen ligase
MVTEVLISRLVELGSLPPRTRIAKFLGEAGLILILCVAVLAPALTLNPNWPQVRTETLMLVVYGLVYAEVLFIGLAKPLRFHAFYVIGLLFSVSVGFSLMYGTIILHHPLSYRDYFEIPKCWLPVFFFTIAYEAELTEQGLNRALNFFALAITLVCLFGWAQFLHLGIAARLTPYYTDMGHNYSVLLRYGRIFSTVGNPNALGQLMSWCLSIYALAFLFGVGSRVRNLSVSLLCVITIALTSSRYGLLACGAGLLIALAFGMSARRRGLKLVGLSLLVAILVPVFGEAQRSSYWASHRFEQLKNPLRVDSLRGRLDYLWIEAGEYFLSSPWVGHGPAKKVFDEVFTDSEYLDILKYYGIFGFLCYLGYYFWPLLEMRKGLRRLRFLSHELEERLRANLLVIRAGFAIFCLALFMNVGEFTFYNISLLAFLWLWAGLAVRAARFVAELEAQESISGIFVEPSFALAGTFPRVHLQLPRTGFPTLQDHTH